MNSKRCLSLLLFLSFLLSCFGSSVSAEEFKDSSPPKAAAFSTAIAPMAASVSGQWEYYTSDFGWKTKASQSLTLSSSDGPFYYLQYRVPFSYKKNTPVTIRLKFSSSYDFTNIELRLMDSDGYWTAIDAPKLRKQGNSSILDVDIVAPYDGSFLYFWFLPFDGLVQVSSFSANIQDLNIQETKTGGLFSSIIRGVREIFTSLTTLPQKIASAIGGFFTALGNTIKDALTALGNFIINGIKGLFVPSDGYFEVFFERMNTFFSDRFGLLYFPVELFIDMIGRIGALGESAPYIQIPQVAWDGNVLIPAQRYDFPFLQEGQLKQIHDYYLMAMDVALIGALIALINKKYREVFAL